MHQNFSEDLVWQTKKNPAPVPCNWIPAWDFVSFVTVLLPVRIAKCWYLNKSLQCCYSQVKCHKFVDKIPMQYPLHMHMLPIIMEFTCHNFAYPDFFYARDQSVLISAFSTSFLHCLLTNTYKSTLEFSYLFLSCFSAGYCSTRIHPAGRLKPNWLG